MMITENSLKEIAKKSPVEERIRVSDNFYLDEFIDPYNYFVNKYRGLEIIDFDLISIAQNLRELYGKPITINNWFHYYKRNKKLSLDKIVSNLFDDNEISSMYYKESGTRPFFTDTGSSKSAHKLYKSIDPKGNEKELLNVVKDNSKLFYRLGVRRIEDISLTRGWLHLDTKEHQRKNNFKVVFIKQPSYFISV